MENIFKSIEKDFEDFVNHFDDIIKEKDNDTEKYYYKRFDKYVNGEHIEHNEKEIVNGEVTKNDAFSKCLSNKKEECDCKCQCNKKQEDYILELERENENLKKTIDVLTNKLKKVSHENYSLDNKLTAIKQALM